MKFVRLDPPGTLCHHEAVFELLRQERAGRFVDVGCGQGGIARKLIARGWSGIGVDFSPDSIAAAERELADEIAAKRLRILQADILTLAPESLEPSDLGMAMMVIEHVEDDVNFVRHLGGLVRPGGIVMVSVPGGRHRWSFEDETVGHLRRYDRTDLIRTMQAAGLVDVVAWSIGVPLANLTFEIGDWLTRHSGEQRKLNLSKLEQTKMSATRDVPFKTVFPSFFRLLLNRVTMAPWFALQRRFYLGNRGTVMLGMGRRPAAAA
jgi:2-polyprenyl-3-methyl-5-hydroxy-6-metoxy-1,4-benzoquinol methylase